MKFSIIGPVHPFRGGIAQHTTALNQALSQNHQTQIISFRRQFPGWLYPGATDRDPSQRPPIPGAEYILDPLYPWTWYRTLQSIRFYNPDLTIIQWWTTFWAIPDRVICRSLQKNKLRVAYLIHNVLPHETRPGDKILARLGLAGTDQFIVQNPHQKDRLLDLYPDASVQVCLLPSFPRLSDQMLNQPAARKQLKLDQNADIILFFGIVREYKGLRTLLQSMIQLKRSGFTPTLVIAGEFWENKQEYIRVINDAGLQNQVIIEDRYLPDAEAHLYFLSADVLVAPYTAGTQSAVTALAGSYGIPVIASQQIADGISPQGSSRVYRVPPGEADELAKVIRYVLNIQEGEKVEPPDPRKDWGRMVEVIEGIAA